MTWRVMTVVKRVVDPRVDCTLDQHVRQLAREYTVDVYNRRRVGDAHAKYHAQRPKVKAYGVLMKAGLTPREAIQYFRSVSEML